MVREFSAGGVVVRRMRDRWWVAVIEPRIDKPKSKPVAALPKGNIDKGERPEDAAQREVLEETGLQTVLIKKLEDIKYVYVRTWSDRQRVFKIVSFYLFAYQSGTLGDITEEMRQEVSSARWVPLDEAPRHLSYDGERSVAQRALQFLADHDLTAEMPVFQQSKQSQEETES